MPTLKAEFMGLLAQTKTDDIKRMLVLMKFLLGII